MRALLLFLLSLSAAHATSILNVTFNPFSQSGVPGQTLTFSGTLQNTTTNQVFILSNSYTFDIGDAGVVNDALFPNNAPLFLADSETSLSFDFFTVTIPLLQAPGIYSGVFTVVGGPDDTSQDLLGDGVFEVEVLPAAQGVPEPASVVLIGAGVAFLAWKRRR